MLTKSCKYIDNILMEEKYFEKDDSDGNKYEFTFTDTHFVRVKLIKRVEWRPFRKIGELTAEGIEFIESKLKDADPIFLDEYSKTQSWQQ